MVDMGDEDGDQVIRINAYETIFLVSSKQFLVSSPTAMDRTNVKVGGVLGLQHAHREEQNQPLAQDIAIRISKSGSSGLIFYI